MNNNIEELHKKIFHHGKLGRHLEEPLPILSSRAGPKLFKKTMANVLKLDPNYDIENFYSLNSFGLRSEEFSQTHNGRHIVFAGCSQTFGVGTYLEDLWAYKLYRKIAEDGPVSGFFNIAVVGITISGLITQIMAYFKKFGYPEILFINLPDLRREAGGIIRQGDNSCTPEVDFDIILRYVISQYTMLLDICSLNNVQVYAISWYTKDFYDHDSLPSLVGRLENVYFPTNNEIEDHCKRFIADNINDKKSKYHAVALDETHHGIAYQDFWYTKMYEMYLKDR